MLYYKKNVTWPLVNDQLDNSVLDELERVHGINNGDYGNVKYLGTDYVILSVEVQHEAHFQLMHATRTTNIFTSKSPNALHT